MVGLLWMDDDKKRSLEQKVLRAVEHCQDVRGFRPLFVQVSGAVLDDEQVIAGVKVEPAQNILPNYFYLVKGA